MKFFILGDSWGVGEWNREYPNGMFIPISETGIDYHFKKLGHQVTNISAGSAGNFGQLRHAYWTLKTHSDYDYIIWFHTESMRDIEQVIIQDPEEGKIQFPDFKMYYDIDKSINYLNECNYSYAQMLFDEFQIPFIIVEGQSPSTVKLNKKYSFFIEVIPWLKELLDIKFEIPCCTFFGWEKIQQILQHYNFDEKKFLIDNARWLDNSQEIISLAKKSNRFPDNAHPDRKCHYQLAIRLLRLINERN